ncbi:MAG: prepilin-type N-terminal cleavage/methylation domain-containing protein [Armatimonadetes bacterium]|nr:prepilin-type N-terminal cleavage/methylation domain-containing protein [Armatimonadota bacterium]
MNRSKKNKGFTLVEIMIVVLIIGILLAIAVPNFVRARETSRTRTCVGNLKQIDSAKEQYAMENRLASGAAVAWANLAPDYLKRQPACPSGGTYTIGNVGTDPTCSTAGHVLP